MASLRASGGDTCQLRPPDTQRLLNYDRAKLVSIKVINFEFNNSPAREEGTGREKERESGYIRAVSCGSYEEKREPALRFLARAS